MSAGKEVAPASAVSSSTLRSDDLSDQMSCKILRLEIKEFELLEGLGKALGLYGPIVREERKDREYLGRDY